MRPWYILFPRWNIWIKVINYVKHPYLFRFGLLTLQAGIVIKQEIYQSFKSDFHMIIKA